MLLEAAARKKSPAALAGYFNTEQNKKFPTDTYGRRNGPSPASAKLDTWMKASPFVDSLQSLTAPVDHPTQRAATSAPDEISAAGSTHPEVGKALGLFQLPSNVSFINSLLGRDKIQLSAGKLAHTATPAHDDLTARHGVTAAPGLADGIGDQTARGVVSHEFGHRWDEYNPATRNVANPYAPYAKIEGAEGTWAADPRELRASIFANAIQYLATTAKQPPAGTTYQPNIELLGKYEANGPGTGEMVRHLIQRPIYANHPMRGAFTAPQSRR